MPVWRKDDEQKPTALCITEAGLAAIQAEDVGGRRTEKRVPLPAQATHWTGRMLAKGTALEDPCGLFNSSLEGNTRRAIDFHRGDKIDEKTLQALIRASVTLNISARATARPVCSQKRSKDACGAS
jgi:hypothetical protein